MAKRLEKCCLNGESHEHHPTTCGYFMGYNSHNNIFFGFFGLYQTGENHQMAIMKRTIMIIHLNPFSSGVRYVQNCSDKPTFRTANHFPIHVSRLNGLFQQFHRFPYFPPIAKPTDSHPVVGVGTQGSDRDAPVILYMDWRGCPCAQKTRASHSQNILIMLLDVARI